MRQGRDAVAHTDLGISQRVVNRPDEVVFRTLELLDERGGHAPCSCAHVDGLGRDAQTRRVGFRNPSIDLHHTDAFTVDGHFHLDRTHCAAEKRAGGLAVQQELELVFAVRRKVVRHHRAPARAERRAVQAILLRAGAGHVVRG